MTEDVTVDDVVSPVGPGCFMQLAVQHRAERGAGSEQVIGTKMRLLDGRFLRRNLPLGRYRADRLPTGTSRCPSTRSSASWRHGSSSLVPDLLNE